MTKMNQKNRKSKKSSQIRKKRMISKKNKKSKKRKQSKRCLKNFNYLTQLLKANSLVDTTTLECCFELSLNLS